MGGICLPARDAWVTTHHVDARTLARLGFEAYVAGQYRSGEVSLRQAAALLGVTLWETLDRLAALGATGNATAESVLAGLDTLEAINGPQ